MEKLAQKGDPDAYPMTIPLQTGQHRTSCNFSFSGLKSGAATLVKKERQRLRLDVEEGRMEVEEEALTEAQVASAEAEFADHVAPNIAASLQRVVVAFLVQRTRRALEWLKQDRDQGVGQFPTCLVVAGRGGCLRWMVVTRGEGSSSEKHTHVERRSRRSPVAEVVE